MTEAEREVRCARCDARLDEARNTPPEQRAPCPSCGSLGRVYPVYLEGTIIARATVSAELVKVEAPPTAEPKTRELQEFGYTVTWYRYPDGLLFVQVHDEHGELLGGGGGDDAEDAILEVAEKLLPPPAAG